MMARRDDTITERRKHRRIAVRLPAFVYTDPDGAGERCVVEDISQGGVGLIVNDMVIKKFFLLQLGPKVTRLCHARWRFGDRLGASFVEVSAKTAHAKSSPSANKPSRAKEPAGV
ncbi:MAG: PilZ domain-containing protein [Xanthobacteraceae bacterium]|nr:PilZ domain-containing protein [Xanthobacteraceae bacterium]